MDGVYGKGEMARSGSPRAHHATPHPHPLTFPHATDGTGALTGVFSADTVEFAGFQIRNQIFAESIKEPGLTFQLAKFDGILGLGYSTISVGGVPSPMDNIISRKLAARNVFAFYLGSERVGDGAASELVVGDVDPAHYEGDIHWVPVVRKG